MIFVLLVVVTLALWFSYRWATANDDFFKKRGIPYDKPFPFFGSLKDALFKKESFFDLVRRLYNAGGGKIFGIFDQRKPVYLIRDPELIKQITIKDFNHFVSHRAIFVDDNSLFGASLIAMREAKWRDMRNTLSPIFTGSKIRQMFDFINSVAQTTSKYLLKDVNAYGKGGLEVNWKDFCTRFTNDVIAATAFGLQVNSFEDKDNKFYRMGKNVTSFNAWEMFKYILHSNFEFLVKLLKLDFFDKEYSDYFMHLVLAAMKYRKDHDIYRPDMINMLMEARGMIKSDNPKPHNREWSDVDIVGQCFLFFFTGFESSATLMCFAAHELMENPDVQQKLLEEIEEASQNLDGKPLTYEVLQGMKYMDMVVSETLRKWPATVALDRQCDKDIVYDVDGIKVNIKSGDCVWIPVSGIHRDPQYYPKPDVFDPERFNDENKDKINPNTYIPFGIGPRNCLGSRFALLEAKAVIFYLVRDFLIEAGKKTTIPLELSTSSFQLIPEKGFWLKFTPRNRA